MNMCIGINSYPRVSQTMTSPVLLNIMEITPSILTADFCKLGETLGEAVKAGVEWFHMDIMDGNWVINKTITFGPAIIKSVRDFLGDEAFIDLFRRLNIHNLIVWEVIFEKSDFKISSDSWNEK